MIGPEPEIHEDRHTSSKDDIVPKIGNGHVMANGKETSPLHCTNVGVTSPSSDITSRPTVTASEVNGDQRDALCELSNLLP